MYLIDKLLENGFKVEMANAYLGIYQLRSTFYQIQISVIDNEVLIFQNNNFSTWSSAYADHQLTLPLSGQAIDDLASNLSLQPKPIKEVKNGSICAPCAFQFGLSWPKDHCATWWQGECSQCGKDEGCCSTGDWNYQGKKVKGLRD